MDTASNIFCWFRYLISSEREVFADVFTIPNSMDNFFYLLQKLGGTTPLNKMKVEFDATGYSSYNLPGFPLNNKPDHLCSEFPCAQALTRKASFWEKTDLIDMRTIASMLLSNINLKFYTSTAYHHEGLKSLTRYNLNLVKERARLKSSISRPDCILFPELKNSFLRCSQFLFIPCWKSFPEPNRLSKLV